MKRTANKMKITKGLNNRSEMAEERIGELEGKILKIKSYVMF